MLASFSASSPVIGADRWRHDKERGWIDGALFKNITLTGGNFPVSSLTGCDATYLVENATFENLRIDENVITDLSGGNTDLTFARR